MDIASFSGIRAIVGSCGGNPGLLVSVPADRVVPCRRTAVVFGTATIMDFRLLGIASRNRPFTVIKSDILKWVWGAFVLTAITGSLMFTTNASVYYDNFFFRTKVLLLALAGINMLVFELTTGGGPEIGGPRPPLPERRKQPLPSRSYCGLGSSSQGGGSVTPRRPPKWSWAPT